MSWTKRKKAKSWWKGDERKNIKSKEKNKKRNASILQFKQSISNFCFDKKFASHSNIVSYRKYDFKIKRRLLFWLGSSNKKLTAHLFVNSAWQPISPKRLLHPAIGWEFRQNMCAQHWSMRFLCEKNNAGRLNQLKRYTVCFLLLYPVENQLLSTQQTKNLLMINQKSTWKKFVLVCSNFKQGKHTGWTHSRIISIPPTLNTK